MYRLKPSLKIEPLTNGSSGELKITNPENGEEILLSGQDVQMLRWLAQYPEEEIVARFEVQPEQVNSFIQFFDRKELLVSIDKPLQLGSGAKSTNGSAPSSNGNRQPSPNGTVAKLPKQHTEPAIVLREDLEFEEDGDFLLIEDPEKNRFFRLGMREAELLAELTETPLPVVIRESGYSQEELLAFIRSLGLKGLLLKPDFSGQIPQAPPKNILAHLLSKRFKLCDPDDFLETVDRNFGWLWKGPMFLIHLGLMFFALCLWITYLPTFQAEGMPQITASSFLNALLFVLSASVILATHEIAHGLTLKSFGGKVKEMGIFLLYGFPSAYTNVSGSYRLAEKSQKVWVILAGVICQCWIGCVAIILWVYSQPGTLVHQFSYLFSLGAFFNLIINLNPLIKLDGYYLLATALDMPNLRSKAWGLFKHGFRDVRSFSEGAFLLGYALLSVLYTVFLVGIIFFALSKFFFSTAPISSIVLVLLLIAAAKTPLPRTAPQIKVGGDQQKALPAGSSAARPATKGSDAPPTQPVNHSTPQQQPTKAGFNWAPLLILLLVVGLVNLKVPFPIGGKVEVRSLPEKTAIIRSEVQAIVDELYIQSGDTVKKGQRLIRLKDWQLLEQLTAVTGSNMGGYGAPNLDSKASLIEQSRLKIQQLQIQLEKARITHAEQERKSKLYSKLAAKGAFSANVAQEAQAEAALAAKEIENLQQEIRLTRENMNYASSDYRSLEEQIGFYRNKSALQEITSPIEGYVLTEDPNMKVGMMASPQESLLSVADLREVEVRVKILQEDLPEVRPGQKVTLVIRAFPNEEFQGTVKEIALASEDVENLDPATASAERAEISRKRWNVRTVIDNSENLLRPGMTGYASIESARELTIGELIGRELFRVFSMEQFVVFRNSVGKAIQEAVDEI